MKGLVLFFSISYGFYWCQGCLEKERGALLQIGDSLKYTNRSFSEEWVGEDCCRWKGVKCSTSTSRVVAFNINNSANENLGYFNFYDPWYLNVSIFAQFKELRELHLIAVFINGWVNPEAFCELKNLAALDLKWNEIDGEIPSCFGKMQHLQYLDLRYNYLHGDIQALLGNMHSIRHLDLAGSQFEGNILPLLPNMHSLIYLDIHGNQFEGNIHPSIFNNLTKIEHIDISENQFEGWIPFSMFANLSKLRYLDLSHNLHLEVETESPTWFPSFQLLHLGLENCNLNKRSGHGIPSFISTQFTLQELDLSDNSLLGSIPSWLLYNVTSKLHLRGNMFGGSFPQLYQNMSSHLTTLDISYNHVYGPLPMNIDIILPNIVVFNMSGNDLQGSIPSTLGEKKSLTHLDLSHNNLSGEIPHSLTVNDSSLIHLFLSNNNLFGEILPRNLNASYLVTLMLHDNAFTGEIPNVLNDTYLQVLDIGNNYISGVIPSLLPSSMYALLLKGNNFEGHIPRKLCELQHLAFLDLSHNHLSGTIPSCLNNNLQWKDPTMFHGEVSIDFTTKGILYTFLAGSSPLLLMNGINLSFNKLTGNIPFEIGDLIILRSLNLSNNLLTGTLPISFQNMEELESLDLSHNKLTGRIPPELIQLDFLSIFNVSFNSLSDMIPTEGQFLTFGEDSYLGNLGLCGQPLERNCTLNMHSPSQEEEEDEEDLSVTDSTFFFYSCVALSFVLYFCGVIVLPIFKKKKAGKTLQTCG